MTEPDPSAQPSKKGLKKAAKEAEKAKKKAEQNARLQEELQLRQKEEAANDFAADNYGEKPLSYFSHLEWVQLAKVDEWEDRQCVFRSVVENARTQSAKLAFVTLNQGVDSIQMVVAESREEGVSRRMVKFAADIPPESLCVIYGIIKRTNEKIKSTTVQDFEVHAKKIFILSRAHVPLPLQPADSEGALPSEEKKEGEEEDAGGPLVSLNTRLNNRAIDLRAKINHCIFILKDGVDSLFQEFLRARGFIRIHTPKIIGAPSEGNITSSSVYS